MLATFPPTFSPLKIPANSTYKVDCQKGSTAHLDKVEMAPESVLELNFNNCSYVIKAKENELTIDDLNAKIKIIGFIDDHFNNSFSFERIKIEYKQYQGLRKFKEISKLFSSNNVIDKATGYIDSHLFKIKAAGKDLSPTILALLPNDVISKIGFYVDDINVEPLVAVVPLSGIVSLSEEIAEI